MSNRTGGLGLRFFGAWEWHTGETPLPRLRSRQGQGLLALLVLRRAVPVERAWLAAALWPESDNAQSLYNLRRNLSDLRRALGAEAWRLRAPTPRSLSLDLSDAECDLIEFDAAMAGGDAASLERAAALYRGPLLPGCLEEWATPERAAREEAVLGALETLAVRAAAAGDWAGAAARCRRALEIDPLRESAARGLMEAQASSGGHAAATQVYRAFRLRLRDELNAEPDVQTVALFQRLRTEGRQAASKTVSAAAGQMPVSDGLGALPEADPAPTNGRLPPPLTPLIGRETEIATVTGLLEQSRLVTLTGIGGIGKTRLAVAVAERVGEQWGGAWFVDLAPLADPELVAQTVLAALGVLERPDCAPSESLAEFLRARRLLLVLDNCEHLAPACARLARMLMQECPALRALATSRETLRVAGEAVWPVPPLSLPATGGAVDMSEAARLFTARAAQADPAFAPTARDRREIAQICRRLDGIPLAIEMAAARMRAMTPAQLCARLDDRFRLLTAAGDEALPHRRTLRATLDWSYGLLGAEERELLAQVSVFAGGWTLEAAEAVCTDAPGVPDLLLHLVDKSLVSFDSGAAGGRYRLLETVRQYAQERLVEVGAWETAHRAHRDYFSGDAARAQASLAGPAEAQWLRRLAADHDNLRAALTWSLAHDAADTALRLACALTRFWRVQGHLLEGRAFLAAALAAASDPSAEMWRMALCGDAQLALAQGRCREALASFGQALAAARRAGDRRGEAAALGGLGAARSNAGEYAEAQGLLEQALALNRALGSREEEAANLSGLGYLARTAGDHAAAEAYLVEAITISRRRGDALAEGESLGSLAYVFLQRGDRQGARRRLGRTLTLYRRLGNRLGEAWTLNSLGDVAALGGHTAKAAMLMRQALAINRAVGNRAGEAWNLSSLGRLQTRTGHHAAGRMTLQQALVIDQDLGNRAGEAATLQALAEAAPPHAPAKLAAQVQKLDLSD